MMEVADAIDRAIKRMQQLPDYSGRPTWDAVVREELGAPFADAQAALAARDAELAALREENESLRHWAWGHVDALLLYAAGSYPEDSHVKDAVAFCRLLRPDAKLRMDPLKASDFHPARAALTKRGQP